MLVPILIVLISVVVFGILIFGTSPIPLTLLDEYVDVMELTAERQETPTGVEWHVTGGPFCCIYKHSKRNTFRDEYDKWQSIDIEYILAGTCISPRELCVVVHDGDLVSWRRGRYGISRYATTLKPDVELIITHILHRVRRAVQAKERELESHAVHS